MKVAVSCKPISNICIQNFKSLAKCDENNDKPQFINCPEILLIKTLVVLAQYLFIINSISHESENNAIKQEAQENCPLKKSHRETIAH